MYKLSISPRAKKHLKRIKEKINQEAIALAIEEIKENPFIGKPLARDMLGKHSYRIGNYRITYKVNQRDKTIEILTAGHRSVVYN